MFWWKIFFWFNILLTVFMVIQLSSPQHQNQLVDIFYLVFTIIEVTGLYAFINRRKIFSKTFWFYFFWFDLVITILYVSYAIAPNDPVLRNLSFLNNGIDTSPKFFTIIVSLLSAPTLYALYNLGTKGTTSYRK